jgi:hypothetical protein
MTREEEQALLKGGIPCSGLKDPDPDSLSPGCQNLATQFDILGVPWCDACKPDFRGSKLITQSELNRLGQQLVDLRKALQPFATFAESLPPIIDTPRLTDAGPMVCAAPLGKNHIITFADIRRAKTLLDALEAEDYERWVRSAEEKIAPEITLLQKEIAEVYQEELMKLLKEMKDDE